MSKSEQQIVEAKRRQWIREGRENAKRQIKHAQGSDGFVVGFRILIGNQCKAARPYNQAFLPIHVARKHPELIPPYEGICRFESCDCDIEDVFESDVLARNTPVIVRPGKVVSLRKLRKKRQPILWLLFLVTAAYLTWRTAQGH